MPTIRRCCIVGCNSNSRLNPNLQFFQFPRPENPFYKLWTQACHASLSRILPFKKPVLCAEHFAPHCIGGRRLTSSAVPSLKLDVSSDMKHVEQQSMVEEIERSRKCAYINAVVYEWLVRANLNPQLRGSITHGMIKEKADTARRIIGCDSFTADNRWLNRFRESHLAGFAQKLASNQLKPMGPSLWIPDIVQELQHMFPPTNAERMDSFENVPEQYVNYMKQYGEYEEDDEGGEQEQQPPNGYGNEHNNGGVGGGYGEQKMPPSHNYYQQQQQQHPHPHSYEAPQGYYQQHAQHPPQHHQQVPPPPSHANAYNPYGHQAGVGLHHPASSYNAYHDYYANERHQQAPYQPHMPPHHNYNGGYHHPGQQTMPPHQPPPQRPLSHSPVQQRPTPPPPPPVPQQYPPQPLRPSSHSPAQVRSSPLDPLQFGRTSPAVKRPYPTEEHSNSLPSSKRASPAINDSNAISRSPPTTPTATKTPPPQPQNEASESNSNDNFKIKLPSITSNRSNNATPIPQASSTPSNANHTTNTTNSSSSRSSSPKSQTDKNSGAIANGHASNGSPTPISMGGGGDTPKELETYAQALEYLKPLEDFALFKENFRAIGLISQLETILKKYNRPPVTNKSNNNNKAIAANGCN
ncbi:trithorax group protein osa-like [Musca vetustissima]|uniref:trithorax group protein osa-like n=1 Tax=Musca vetustissima TaxID=27455 RepID=UPI002AB740A9|nr:trithorax group protein osa-like [Musca vetustissima]